MELVLNGQTVLFFLLAICVIVGAMLMISFTKVVHMVVSLAFVFLSLAGIYILLEAEFVAFVQVLVYAGAISILMIFGIMMTRHDKQEEKAAKSKRAVLAFIGCAVLFGALFFAIRGTTFPATEDVPLAVDNTLQIGKLLYTEHVIPFELLSVLLTVAFIGAIVLAKSDRGAASDKASNGYADSEGSLSEAHGEVQDRDQVLVEEESK